MTILELEGGYPPAEVRDLDLVGYRGDGVFVILNPTKGRPRELPKAPEGTLLENIPVCIRARIENNQVVNFAGKVATLHDIDGEWHYRLRKPKTLQPLAPFTFFEIGEVK